MADLLTEKIATGVTHDGPVLDVEAQRQEARREDLTKKRDQGMWYVIVGIALLFAGNISNAFAVGGVLSIGFGVLTYARHAIRLAKLSEDPWKDPELDRWEEEHYGDGEGGDAEGDSIVEPDPDSAWGGKLH